MPVSRDECGRLPMAGGRLWGKSDPPGLLEVRVQRLKHWMPTAWALREQGKESPREERRRAFPGAGTPWEKEAARLVVGPSLRGSPWRGKQTVLPECSNPAATHPHWTLTTRRSIVCWGTRSSWASFAQPPPFTDGETEVQRGVLTLTPAPLPPEAIVLW